LPLTTHLHQPRMKWLLVAAAVLCYISLAEAKKVKPAIFKKYTKSATGCKCWFDLEMGKECACCNKKVDGKKADSMQCGYPMHKYCYKKTRAKDGTLISKGCPGIPQPKFTLSTKGFACYFKNSNTKECAWCADGGYQCGPGARAGLTSKNGNHCITGRNKKYCDSVIGDCRHIPGACSSAASCVEAGKFGKGLKLYKCECDKGFTGNGIDCYNEDGELHTDAANVVEVEMTLHDDFYQFPHEAGQFPQSPSTQALIKEMGKVDKGCGGDECESTFVDN